MKIFRRHVFRILCGWAFLMLHSVVIADTAQAGRADVNYVMEKLHKCPAWIYHDAGEQEKRETITQVYYEIAVFDNQTIRAAIKQYLRKYGKKGVREPETKVFALMRVLFNIPAGFIEWERNYGTLENPVKDGRVDLLWPYQIDAQGKLVLAGEALRIRTGLWVPYDALAEFDKLTAHFARRAGRKGLGGDAQTSTRDACAPRKAL